MSELIYADGLKSIRVMQGSVRMELYRSDNPNGEDKEVAYQLTMAPQGFVSAFVGMYRVIAQLEKAGYVRLPNDLPKLSGMGSPERTAAAVPASIKNQEPKVEKAPLDTGLDDDGASPNFN